MTNTRSLSVAEIEEFLNASNFNNFSATNKTEAYHWIEKVILETKYWHLKRKNRGIIRTYLAKMTGYSFSQIDRLIVNWKIYGHVKKKEYKRVKFAKVYQKNDISLAAETTRSFGYLSGPAMIKAFKREYKIFGDNQFERLAKISTSHFYNLRHTETYQNISRIFEHTKPVSCPIGERRKPAPDGSPGYIRVDTVHQGDDQELGKSVYHINFVDEVTQWELVACVPQISERYLAPVFKEILKAFPFVVLEFHSDNGSEFINKKVNDILNRLKIRQTKSRPGKSNDNGLVETKNNAIIRKEMGYAFIAKEAHELINDWYKNYYNIFLNFHRPCGFATIEIDDKGRRTRKYKPCDYQVPYEKLKSLPNAKDYLRPDIKFADLDKIAYSQSSLSFTKELRQAKLELFNKINKQYFRRNLI
jgi:hypothetical protein